MANKKNIWCILITVLAFGLLLTGCPTETTEDNNPFKGTWKDTGSDMTITFSNDTFEIPKGIKGTYTRNDKTATLKTTQGWIQGAWQALPAGTVPDQTVTIDGETMTINESTFKKQ